MIKSFILFYVTYYTLHTKKTVTFLCTNKEIYVKNIRKTIPNTIAVKMIRYLWLNLNKEVKDMYTENYKHWRKKSSKTDTYKCSSWVGRINILKMSILYNMIYSFKIIPTEIPMVISTGIEKNPKIYMEQQKTQNS